MCRNAGGSVAWRCQGGRKNLCCKSGSGMGAPEPSRLLEFQLSKLLCEEPGLYKGMCGARGCPGQEERLWLGPCTTQGFQLPGHDCARSAAGSLLWEDGGLQGALGE